MFQDKEKLDQLNELLNAYSLQGLPPPPSLIQIGQPHLDEKTFQVESDWRLIVDNSEVIIHHAKNEIAVTHQSLEIQSLSLQGI